MIDFKKYQDQFIGVANSIYRNERRLSVRVIDAFYKVPRHKFVERYRSYGNENWIEVNESNLDQHLGTLYADNPLVLKGTDEEFRSKKGSKQLSTISQPSFVLHALDLLDIKEGQSVFELGTASGWNACLMSFLTGDTGKVFTAEIIPELAESAKARIERLGIKNVTVLSGDAGDGSSDGAPFDRVMFTAGAFDLPEAFHKQIKEGGLLLFILKNKGGADNLLLLKKNKDHFESKYASPCGFVPMTGKHHLSGMEEQDLSSCLRANKIEDQVISEIPFWWGSGSDEHFMWQTGALRSFLSLFENFLPIYTDIEKDEGMFGWRESGSLALARPGKLVNYGNETPSEYLISKIKCWVDIGMPTISNLHLKVYAASATPKIPDSAWVSRRKQSLFVWTLPRSV
jgi:protein-L-isoaspartate(D-aspartate) O-methyltransferase